VIKKGKGKGRAKQKKDRESYGIGGGDIFRKRGGRNHKGMRRRKG